MSTKFFFLLSVFLLITPKLTFAHEGGHAEEKKIHSLTEKTAPLNDSIYSIGTEEHTEFPSIEESPLNSPFSNINPLDDDILLIDDMKTNEPMKRFKEKANAAEQHDQHKTQHVEESLHEWVSPNAKGYTVAISMTILSGLAFMVLSFSRIGEKN